jgi:Putative restriction endonuclease
LEGARLIFLWIGYNPTMASVLSTSPTPETKRQNVPPLGNGDRLTRDEFERRYRATPKVNKAELIEGVVYMPSPVRHGSHSKPHSILNAWIVHYAAKTPGLDGFGDNGTVRLDNDNEPQPDLYLMLPVRLGGQAKIDPDDYISGAPALVCEISGSSVSIDLHLKKTAYRRNGVQEYLVWRTEDSAIDWFSLVAGDFIPIAPESDGTLRSRVFPGLWLNPASVISADLPAVFALLDRSTSLPEHADFVKRLATT